MWRSIYVYRLFYTPATQWHVSVESSLDEFSSSIQGVNDRVKEFLGMLISLAEIGLYKELINFRPTYIKISAVNMLTFFRKIRKSFLDSSSVRKYFLYAIGEFLLIVAGILVAMQINNWNENQQVQNKIDLQLRNLKTAIQLDIETNDRVLGMEGFRFHAIKYLLELAGETVKLYDYNYDEFPNRPKILWNKPIPENFDRAYVEACFSAIDIGTASSIINDKAIVEFSNSGLFSELYNPQLKWIINDYYRDTEMWFSGAHWDDNLELTVQIHNLFQDHYQIDLRRMGNVKDPIGLIRENQPIKIQLHTLLDRISWNCELLVNGRKRAEQVILAIDQELGENG